VAQGSACVLGACLHRGPFPNPRHFRFCSGNVESHFAAGDGGRCSSSSPGGSSRSVFPAAGSRRPARRKSSATSLGITGGVVFRGGGTGRPSNSLFSVGNSGLRPTPSTCRVLAEGSTTTQFGVSRPVNSGVCASGRGTSARIDPGQNHIVVDPANPKSRGQNHGSGCPRLHVQGFESRPAQVRSCISADGDRSRNSQPDAAVNAEFARCYRRLRYRGANTLSKVKPRPRQRLTPREADRYNRASAFGAGCARGGTLWGIPEKNSGAIHD
jgi:hypothetical protein